MTIQTASSQQWRQDNINERGVAIVIEKTSRKKDEGMVRLIVTAVMNHRLPPALLADTIVQNDHIESSAAVIALVNVRIDTARGEAVAKIRRDDNSANHQIPNATLPQHQMYHTTTHSNTMQNLRIFEEGDKLVKHERVNASVK